MKSGIYKLYWLDNKYYYYGQALDFKKRLSEHYSSMKRGLHRNPLIKNLYNKYGFPEYEIIEECEIEYLDSIEQKYLNEHLGKKYCCNMNPLATSSKGIKHSKETVEKNRVSHLKIFDGEKNPFYGRKHTEETKNKLRMGRMGKTNIKISIAKTGVKASDEAKRNMSAAKKYGGRQAKLVIDIETGVYYRCAQEVADLYNIPNENLRRILRGDKGCTNNTVWRWA